MCGPKKFFSLEVRPNKAKSFDTLTLSVTANCETNRFEADFLL